MLVTVSQVCSVNLIIIKYPNDADESLFVISPAALWGPAAFCETQSKQHVAVCCGGKSERAPDLRHVLKSHNKAIIQSKHLRCSDSKAAVDGCKLIMNFDSPALELMTHLFKRFTRFCGAVKKERGKKKNEKKRGERLYSFHGLIERPH